jgi:hypothetical protein
MLLQSVPKNTSYPVARPVPGLHDNTGFAALTSTAASIGARFVAHPGASEVLIQAIVASQPGLLN